MVFTIIIMCVSVSMQICKHVFITFYKNAYNYCTLAIEMNGIPSFFPSIIGLLIKDALRGTDTSTSNHLSTGWLKVFAKMTPRRFSLLSRTHVYLAVTAETNSVWLWITGQRNPCRVFHHISIKSLIFRIILITDNAVQSNLQCE